MKDIARCIIMLQNDLILKPPPHFCICFRAKPLQLVVQIQDHNQEIDLILLNLSSTQEYPRSMTSSDQAYCVDHFDSAEVIFMIGPPEDYSASFTIVTNTDHLVAICLTAYSMPVMY